MIKQRVAVLGSGYIGTYLKQLNKGHYEIKCYSKSHDHYDRPELLMDILEKYKPDYVINACGYTGRPNVDSCEKHKSKCWELNVSLPVMVATVCKSMRIPCIHISSGCIYTGYDKDYTEKDPPNFGMYNDGSSWYSKTKHAAEIAMKNTDAYILRIRMPFDSTDNDRNFLCKILKYENLIRYDNSMTCVEDFVEFIEGFLDRLRVELNSLPWNRNLRPGVFNVCNPGSTSIYDVVREFKHTGIGNSNWKFVDVKDLDLKANRSNCILDCTKISKLGLQLPPVEVSLKSCIGKLSAEILAKFNENQEQY